MSQSPYSRTRNKQLVRVLRLMRCLTDGWRDLAWLTSEMSVSSRTVRRDLAAIEEAHLPLRHERSDDGERATSLWTLRSARCQWALGREQCATELRALLATPAPPPPEEP